ncbi:hypothetical protein FC99_GL001029 [Levilactobacillus koreensis JCM 16448]|uniref:S-layer protein n=1 Tax=Levilactobacillus koreensis TaxID=637971 RepID=A0AAC8UXM8_9LACO|nr:hypothetical protein [Levilactobacillus koreensis]AKP65822.1 hypothetical protein ABN16_12920 [Levilactobacillus koreensis]KRK87205.1 hypothetical protein FC99_GL001029 [Levilactobacillus koreensis JCM 16448]
MQKTHLIKALFALSVALFVGGTVTTVDASAKAVKTKGFRVVKITKNTHYTKTSYTKKSPKKGVTLYSSRYLTKHTTSKKTKTFYSTQSIRVVKSTGKTATYRYVKNTKGSVKGWIWTGNLKGKQGKTTSVSNKTVIAPTTNVKIASKITLTPLKQTSNVKPAKTDNAKIYVISDAVSNSNYKGAKNVATLRDKINKLGYILKNYPNAWDAEGAKSNQVHRDAYFEASLIYNNALNDYQGFKTSLYGNKLDQGAVNEELKQVNWKLNTAKY